MKKFLFNVAAFFLIICLLTTGINFAYTKLDTSDDDYTRKFSDVPQEIEICNLGSSHGLFGFNYAELEDEYTCFNFALVSQYPSYDLRLLEAYADNLGDGCVVIIQNSYFSLIGIGEEEYGDFESKNKRYYKILPDEYVKEYDRKTDFLVSVMPSLNARADLIRAAAGKLRFDNHPNMDRTADMLDIEESAQSAYESHFIINKVDQNGEIIINQSEIDAVYDIIEMCRDNGWKPVLVTTPCLGEYMDRVYENEPEFMEWYKETMNKIAGDIDTAYFDYALDERFSDRYDLFVDADHMNREGAKLFTSILYDEVIEDMLEEN